jgi:hypothetical protein
MSHYRRPNPEAGTYVGYGLGAAAVALLGYFGWKAYSKHKETQAGLADPLAALPPFDPQSSDHDSGYLVSVFTTAPVHVDFGLTGSEFQGKGTQVKQFLANMPIDHLFVAGPFNKTPPPPDAVPADPAPPFAIVVNMRGEVIAGMTDIARWRAEAIQARGGK